MTPLFITYALCHVLDMVLTYFGIQRFGLESEGNPIVRWAITHWGFFWAAVIIKVPAIIMGYWFYDITLYVLIFLMLILAIIPWSVMLLIA